MGKLNLNCWCADIQQYLNKVEKKTAKSAKNYTVSHCSFFSFVQIRLNNSASSIVQAQISHPFLLFLKPSLGAEWIVEWKEFSSKVPVCRATLPPWPRLAAPCRRRAAARSSSADILWMTWRVKLCLNSSQVRNLSFDQESFHKICLRAAFSRQLKSSFPLLTQKEFGEGDNSPKRVGSSHGG